MPWLKINYDNALPVFEEVQMPDDDASMAFLDACYSIIECQSIEVVPTILPGVVLIIDEEGKLFDGWQKKINQVATVLYGSSCDCIVGNAIVCMQSGENLIPISSADAARLRSFF